MTDDNLASQFQDLIRKLRVENGHMTLQEFADACALPSGVTFHRQSIWKWSNGGYPTIDNCRSWALYGATPLARQFGRDGLAIYGLQVIEGGE